MLEILLCYLEDATSSISYSYQSEGDRDFNHA